MKPTARGKAHIPTTNMQSRLRGYQARSKLEDFTIPLKVGFCLENAA
jgi:hypothetical protein